MFKKTTVKNLGIKLYNLLGIAILVSVFCLIFIAAHRAIFDLDIWLHLKAGEFISQHKIIPTQDIFSFTVGGRPWVDHEWLFQVLTYLVYSRWQADGLIFLQCALIISSFLVLFVMGYKALKSYLEVGVFILLVAYASLSRFNIRPDMFSLFFFVLFLYILKFHIDKKIIWLLLAIQLLWVNIHGYFFLGPLVLLLFIVAEFLRRKLKFLPWQWKEGFALSDTTYQRLKTLFFLSILISFFNPQGFKGALYPLYILKEVLSGESAVFFKYIQELQPTISMTKSLGSHYYIIIVICLVSMALNLKSLKIIDLLLFVFFFLFSFKVRNIAFFSFMGYAVTISCVGPVINKVSAGLKAETRLRQAIYFWAKFALAATLIVWPWSRINAIFNSSYYYDFDTNKLKSTLFGIDEKCYPKGAVDFILAHKIPGELFNDFNSGAYLIGRAYPKRKVFIDGRTELYGAKFFRQYQSLMDGDVSVFKQVMEKYNLSAILLSMTSAQPSEIITQIYKSPQWKLVFFDDTGVVFLKDILSHRELIQKYKIDLSKYKVPPTDLQAIGLRKVFPAPYLKRAALFSLLGEYDLVILEAQEALRVMPTCFEAYRLRGKAYLCKKLYPQALENLRIAALYQPRNVEILMDLANCLEELKDPQSALNVLKQALKINPRLKMRPCKF